VRGFCFLAECPFMPKIVSQLPCYECPVWAHLRLWIVKSERLFSPMDTLKIVSWGAAFGTQQTLVTVLS
jgi:hypothetical protein